MLGKKLLDLREKTRNGWYRQFRTVDFDFDRLKDACGNLSQYQVPVFTLSELLAAEQPVIIPGERLQFTRTIGQTIPWIPSGTEMKKQGKKRARALENLSPDYEILLEQGIAGRLAVIERELKKAEANKEATEFLTASRSMLESVCLFAERYAVRAEETGEAELAALLRCVPRNPARTLQEALQSIYFMSAMFRLSPMGHVGFGRMDQYLIDYYRNDIATGRETPESARELIAEFFLILCRDYDIFDGMQRGDNGQSVMLGGCRRDGSPAENELTVLFMDISAELGMIDPKINLRVSSTTSQECLISAARLSGCGLGFPQYCNDEQIIPGLVKFGYPLEDARDYTVAACWEYVVKNGRDLPNIFSMNLALAADRAIRRGLRNNESFDNIVQQYLPEEMRRLLTLEFDSVKGILHLANPLFSAFAGDCLEKHRDLNISGGEHCHYGCHGCASSTAADSLAAVKKLVYDEKSIAPKELLNALEANYRGYDELRRKIKDECPHVGCNSPEADKYLKLVFDTFADVLAEVRDNGRGGRIRPGTGSALNYVAFTKWNWGQHLEATADGRCEGEYFSSSLAPAPGVKAFGMLSVMHSYGVLDYTRLCNGGPITMEIDPVCFESPEAAKKMTELIRAFVRSGCQQLQWNILNPEILRHAQKFPAQHRDLVVRVWGWSGFFVELDKVFQDQIIGRQAFRG